MPRNAYVDQLSSLAGFGELMEVEQNILIRKFKTFTFYYGQPVNYNYSF